MTNQTEPVELTEPMLPAEVTRILEDLATELIVLKVPLIKGDLGG